MERGVLFLPGLSGAVASGLSKVEYFKLIVQGVC